MDKKAKIQLKIDRRKLKVKSTMKFVKTSEMIQNRFKCFVYTFHWNLQKSMNHNVQNRNETQTNISEVNWQLCERC